MKTTKDLTISMVNKVNGDKVTITEETVKDDNNKVISKSRIIAFVYGRPMTAEEARDYDFDNLR